jgi:hypothetical protein
LYSGAEIQLAQAPEVIENGVKLDVIKVELAEVRAKTDNLPAAPAAVGDAMTLTSAYDPAKTEPPTASEIATQVEVAIINDDDGRAVLQAIADKIMAEEVTSTVIAQSVRTELATELARIDAPISSRSTLTAEDINAGMTPEQAEELGEVVANTRATFASVNKLTQ